MGLIYEIYGIWSNKFPSIVAIHPVGAGEGIGDGVGLGDGIGDGLGDGIGDGVGVGLGDGTGDGVGDGAEFTDAQTLSKVTAV